MVRLSRVFILVTLAATAASAHQLADIRLSFDVPPFVPLGHPFTYRVIADDLSNDEGAGIVVTIALPPEVRFTTVAANDWNCAESQLTITCTADEIAPGPSAIEVNVIAPSQPGPLHASAKVESQDSLDPNAANDSASSEVIAFDPEACNSAPPQLLGPADHGNVPPVVPLTWLPVARAVSYTVYTSVEGAAAAPVMTVTSNAASLIAEPGRSEWWVTASFTNCPPLESPHRHFTAPATLPRPVRIFAGDPAVDRTIDGPRVAARFRSPFGLALSPAGELYVSDQIDNVVRRIAGDEVTTIAGAAGVAGDAVGQFARFRGLRGLTVTPVDGFVYAADALNHEVRILYTGGAFVTTFNVGGSPGIAGYADDVGDKSRFDTPSGVASTERGTLFVADTANNRIRKMTPVPDFVGLFDVSTVGSGFHAPLGVAVDANENVYVADTGDGTIRKVDGSVIASGFDHPAGITVDTLGNLFVTDRRGVYRIAPSGLVTTIATGLDTPGGIAVDPSGRVYVADSAAHAIVLIDLPQDVSRRRTVR